MAKTGISAPKTGKGWAVMLLPTFLIQITAIVLLANRIIGLTGFGILVMLAIVPALVLSFRYWGRLDEPSREAHTFGFVWGGGMAGAAIAVIALAMMFFEPMRNVWQGLVEGWIAYSKGAFGEEEGAVGAYLAVYVSAVVQMLGYLFVWIGWWARQRIGTKAD